MRHDRLHLTLDVPDDATQRVAHETIAFAVGQCVGYHETFESGAGRDGAYVCQLSSAAPAFELRSGGPAVAAMAIGRGMATAVLPVAGAALATASIAPSARLRESIADATNLNANAPSPHFVRPASAFAISPAVTELVSRTFNLTSRAVVDGPAPAGFREAVMADLQTLYDTTTGRKLLESLQASGKRIDLFYGKANGAAFPDASTEYPHGYWPPAFYAEDGITCGAGTAMGIAYNPFKELIGKGENPWLKRPPAIGLAHELIHAEQAAYGHMRRGAVANGEADPDNPDKPESAHIYELETVGVPPYDEYALTENKIRADWKPPQPRRKYY